jgi:hypothetical protein
MVILEKETFEAFGYYPSELKPGSNKKIIVKCNNCGELFSVPKAETSRGWGRFCSKSCKYEGSRVSRIERKCEICGKTFFVYECELRRRPEKYCSRSCMGRGRKAEKSPFWKGGEVKRKCEICGTIFFASQAEVKRGMARYCSKSCAGIGRRSPRIKRKCQTCGKIFFVVPSKLRFGWAKYCSKVCARKGRKGFPNQHTKPELLFEGICKRNNLPFHYTGNGSLWIGKKGEKQLNPDFIEANGKKVCVEIMGDYWHSPLLNRNMKEHGTLEYRKRHYKRYKWHPIFIWETDLKREDAEAFVLNEISKHM